MDAEDLKRLGSVGPSAEPAPDILEAIRRQIEERPDATAVDEGDRTVSYRELGRRMDRVAARLSGSQSIVGVCLPRSSNLIAAWVGALKSGRAYLPLDPEHPDERLRFMLADAEADVVLTDAGNVERFRGLGIEVLDIEEALAAQTDEAPASPPEPGGLAYVLYTSGSTGKPKGVRITRRNLSEYIAWAERSYLDGQPARFAFFTSPAFDLTVTSALAPLACGGSVVVQDSQDGAAAVRRVFTGGRCDIVKLTPSHLALLRDLDLSNSSVRKLILGGEDLKPSWRKRSIARWAATSRSGTSTAPPKLPSAA